MQIDRWHFLTAILQPARLTSIVDIGANPINPAPYDLLLQEGLVQVYGFEPQDSAYTALMNAPKKNRVVLPYAVANGKLANLYVCKESGFTSLLKPNPDAIKYLGRWTEAMEIVETVKIQTKRLDDIDEIEHVDLIKIDIQGGELAAFKGGTQTLSKAVAVFTEIAAIPIYKNQPLLHDQMKFLTGAGFQLHKFDFFKRLHLTHAFSGYLQKRLHRNQLVDGDAIFLRSLLELENLEDEALKHLAIISDAIVSSYDLVLVILDILLQRNVISSKDDVLKYCEMLPSARQRRLRQARKALE